MDVNGQIFWMLAEENHFLRLGLSEVDLPSDEGDGDASDEELSEPTALSYDQTRRCLKLSRQRQQISFTSAELTARDHLEQVPQTQDAYQNIAFWNSIERQVMVTGALAGAVEIYSPPVASSEEDSNDPTDLLMGHDGVLYMAFSDQLILQDRRQRWDDQFLSLGNFTPWRLASGVEGSVWILDRENSAIGRVIGKPIPKRFALPTGTEQAGGCQRNDNPPRIIRINDGEGLDDGFFASNEEPVAIAANSLDEVAVLSWLEDGTAQLRLISNQNGGTVAVSEPITLNGVLFPYSIAWHEDDKIAVLVAGSHREVPVYSILSAGSEWWPIGDLYPLVNDFSNTPFVHTLSRDAHYPIAGESSISCKAVSKLSYPFYVKQGFAYNNHELALLDSQDPNMTWHRLYIEAAIPKNCGVRVWLAATDVPADPAALGSHQWFEHRFGESFRGKTDFKGPIGVWEPVPSEIPHSEGFLPCDIEANHCGLFSVLIQRHGKQSSALKGRYLHISIELTGTGRTSPEIYAIRAYGSRFSYVSQYLPEFYQETMAEPDASINGPSTPADFLERFVGNFEGVLTRLEGRIADARLLTLPETIPEDNLAWLASWTGIELDHALTEQQKRKILRRSHLLNRWRGTIRGLKWALELATEGGISGGEIVVLEDYKMRRTFATIVGANLDDEDDPLTLGGRVSGNSYVGDTLFIGDENKKEFLALFSADLDIEADESDAIFNLFDRLAHRVTILVHNEIDPQDLGLIETIAEREAPSHVVVRVVPASKPFLVGMAALVGVDTYLSHKPQRASAAIGNSHLSRYSFISGPASLDPRLSGMGSGFPQAIERLPTAVVADVTEVYAADVTLDASASRAWEGRRITEYHWSINED